MQKRRFLATLLAAVLLISAFPIMAYVTDDVTLFSNNEFGIYSTNAVEWQGTNGENIIAVGDSSCMNFEQEGGYKYQFSYKAANTLAAGDYKLSVTMRFDPEAYAETDYANYINGTKSTNTRGCLVDNGIVVGVNAGVHNHNNSKNILIGGADNDELAVTSFNKDGKASDNIYALAIDDEWHTFDIEFTMKQDQEFIHFGAIVFFMNIRSDFTIPIQVSNISLVNANDGSEYTKGMDAKYWTYRKGNGYDYDVTITEEISHFTTKGIGVRSIRYVGSDSTRYSSGGYTLKTSVRGDIGTVISADIGGKTASYTLKTNTWENVELTFDGVSSFNMSDITVSFDSDIDFTKIELVNNYISKENTEWAGIGNEPIRYIDDGEYLSFEQTEGYKYQFHYKAGNTLEAGDYKLSVTMRFDPEAYAETDYANYINGTKASNTRGCLVDNGIVVGINANRHNYPANNILIADANNDVLTVTAFNKDGKVSDNTYALGIDDEWHTFDIEFTLKQAQTLTQFGAVVFCMNIRSDFSIPVQVSDISLVNETTNSEYTRGMDPKYWGYRKTDGGYLYDVTISEAIPHYTTKGTSAEAIKYIGSDLTRYESGVYTLKMNVCGKAGTVLTANVKKATASYTFESGEWETAELKIDTADSFTMSDITIGFQGDIDFTTIELINTYIYNSKWSTNGVPVAVINDLYGSSDTNEYIHVYDRVSPLDLVQYRNDDVNLSAGEKYTMSVYLREGGITEDKTYSAIPLQIYYSATTTDRLVTSDLVTDSLAGDFEADLDAALVTGGWKKYMMTFTPVNDQTGLKVIFKVIGNTALTASFDIDALSLVDSDGTELITNGVWETVSYSTDTGIKLAHLTESEYNRGINDTDENTTLTYFDNEYAAGTYTVSGKFRIASRSNALVALMLKKCRPDLYLTLVSGDSNKATIGVYADDTLYGSAEITTEWKDITFTVTSESDFSSLKIVASTSADIDFDDLTVEKAD